MEADTRQMEILHEVYLARIVLSRDSNIREREGVSGIEQHNSNSGGRR